jgi:hypothetical protein
VEKVQLMELGLTQSNLSLDFPTAKRSIPRMRIRFCFSLVACVFSVAAMAEDFTGKSPDGRLAFGSKNEKELYIWFVDRPTERSLLFRQPDVFIQAAAISPDDHWIAVEHGGSSLGHTILFFKHVKGLDYQQVGGGDKDPDPAEQVGSLALQSKGFKENILDHSYLHPVAWSADSKWLTVSLDAKGRANGKTVQVTAWRCLYNPVSHELQSLKSNPGKIEVTGG